MQAIVVPVNNWLEPNVGDGKQEVCHSTQPLPSHCSLQLHLHDSTFSGNWRSPCMQTNSCRCVGKSLVDTAVQGVMGMCEWQKRRRIITSFPAN